MNNRIKWIDIAKFIGIFLVFVGHLGNRAGLIYKFVWNFHVPLFFFLAGCTEKIVNDKLKNKNVKIKEYVVKNFKKIIIPFFLFSFLSMIIYFIINNNANNIKEILIIVLNGCIRNQFVAGSLWFLTCLFFMKIIFYFIKKIFKHNYIVVLICIVSSFVMYHYIMKGNPTWIYNIDSALYYIVYYAFGYYLFNIINKFLSSKNKYAKVINIFLLLLTFYYAAELFFGNDLLEFLTNINIVNKVYYIIKTVILILFIVLLSRTIDNFDVLGEIGKNTLYLCGSEYIVKKFFNEFISMFGLSITLQTPLGCILYVILLIIICYYILIPIEKKLLDNLTKTK